MNISHGGARKGAGRPKIGISKRVMLTLDPKLWEKLEGENVAGLVRELIESHLESERETRGVTV